MQTYSWGTTPDAVVKAAALEQCPDGYPMELKNQDEWTALSAAWNVGIDAHLEALCRSTADNSTGRVCIHPEELHVLLRRLGDLDGEALWPDWDYERENNPAEGLRSSILYTLDIEEV